MKSQNYEDIVEVLVYVTRVTKVVEGGRKFAFSALVVVGNKAGYVGYGHAKAQEVVDAKNKAGQLARRNLVKVPIYHNRTIHHNVYGNSGASKVLLRRAKSGTGIIAGGAMRPIFELVGIHDIVAKSLGSTNPYTMVSATFDAFAKLCAPRAVAARRGGKISELSKVKFINSSQEDNENNGNIGKQDVK